MSEKSKRKRTKLQCSCGSIFDDDYRKKRENLKHEGKRMQIKTLGAPENPFTLMKRAKNLSELVIEMNSLRVENFLLYYSIRCGAVTILWTAMLSFLFAFTMFLSFLIKIKGVVAIMFSHNVIVLFVGEVLAVLTLIYFPAPNKTYSPDSKTAKYLKYFAWYFLFIIVMLMLIFYSLIEDLYSNYEYQSLDFKFSEYEYVFKLYVIPGVLIALPFLLTVAAIHSMAVMYTFYLSILPNNNLDEIHNDVNVCTNDIWMPISTLISACKLFVKE